MKLILTILIVLACMAICYVTGRYIDDKHINLGRDSIFDHFFVGLLGLLVIVLTLIVLLVIYTFGAWIYTLL